MDMINGLAKEYPNQFEIQIMFYYGDNCYTTQQSSSWCSNNTIHCSEWTSNTDVFKTFLSTVSASGGSGHEAIEVALHHLYKSHKEVGVRKAIFIGDAGLSKNYTTS